MRMRLLGMLIAILLCHTASLCAQDEAIEHFGIIMSSI